MQPPLAGCVRRALQTLSQVRLRLRPKRAATLRNSAATQRLTVDTMTCFPAFGLSWLVSALRFDCRHCDMPRAQSEIPLQVNRLEWVHYGAMSKGYAKDLFLSVYSFCRPQPRRLGPRGRLRRPYRHLPVTKIQQLRLQQSDSGMLWLQQSDKHLFLWGAGQRPRERRQTRRHQVGHFV